MTAEKNSVKQMLPSYIILCFFAAFNVCFFMPMDIYVANANDIDIPIKPLAACLGLITAAVFAVALLVCLLTKGKANRVFRAALFGASIAFYIQGNFLAVNMGLLNGEQYAPPVWKIALNIVIWLAVLALPFFLLRKLPDEFDALLSYIPAAVLLVQLIALGASMYNSIPKYSLEKLDFVFSGESMPYCSIKDLEIYSRNKNLIVIIADEYDSFLFDGAVKEAPDSVSEFDGFTFYSNTVGKHNMTVSAIAHITSGSAGDGMYKNLTFFQNAAANFKANFYFDIGVPPASVVSGLCNNVGTAKMSLENSMVYTASVYKLAFFRCMPEILKPLFWFDGKNIGEGLDKSLAETSKAELGAGLYDFDNLAFYNNLPRELVIQDEDVFKFMYILGVHTPRSVTKDLQRSENAVSPEDEAIAVNRIVNEYLKILKENGVYDNSEIFFMADHGLSENLGKIFPLLTYKPAYSDKTGISISNAPISYDDMFPTLVMVTGGEPQARTIFDIKEDEERVRYFGADNEELIGSVSEIAANNS